MKLMIVGSKGQLGRELERKCESAAISFAAANLPEIDITNASQLESLFGEAGPAVVVNAAAYTAVDAAESDRQACYAVNSSGPGNLARICMKSNVPLIHVSTDYVFDGKGNRPYKEDDPVCPLGVYGASKAEGEKEVAEANMRHIIVRTSWLYGVFGKNFVKTMLRLGNREKSLRVVDDQYGCPTSAADLADAILNVCSSIAGDGEKEWGVYHYCGKGVTTWNEFAKAVFEIARESGMERTPRIVPVPTAKYPTAAARPKYSELDCAKIQKVFGIEARPWRESLKTTIEEILGTEIK